MMSVKSVIESPLLLIPCLSNIRAALADARRSYATICPHLPIDLPRGPFTLCPRHDKGDWQMKLGTGPLVKGLMVALVALVVLVPVQMLRGLIEERARLRQEAVASVARGWGGEQVVGGPILAIPVTLAPDGVRAPTAEIDWFVLPESLTLESELKVLEERR
jgi:hypothetical protein